MSMQSPSRRSLLKMVALGGAALTVLPNEMAGKTTKPAAESSVANDPWAIFHPLAPGNEIALGWSIAAIAPVIEGAAILHLTNERGASARVRICRNSGTPIGIAHTDRYDFLIMNGGG